MKNTILDMLRSGNGEICSVPTFKLFCVSCINEFVSIYVVMCSICLHED